VAPLALNPPQQAAVAHGAGPCLVIAGAGSGKTRVLTERIGRLVGAGTPPWRLLGFTFTNKAAGEMRRRLEASLGEAAGRLWLGTFHATGVRILRREWEALGLARDFGIYDAEDQLSLLKSVMKELALPEGSLTPQAARAAIEQYKNQLLDPVAASEQAQGYRDGLAARVYTAYQKGLARAQALDFTDLIALPVRLFAENAAARVRWAGRFDFVLVDEFQDTNPLQMHFIEHLASSCGNLFVVGDDDQSIYGWRGADLTHILEFERRHPGAVVIRLEQNYRSTRPILEAANAVIAHNRKRKGKQLWTSRSEGQPVRVVTLLDEEEEAETVARRIRSQAALGTPLGGFAVLYRTHAQSRALEAALSRQRLPYQIVGGTRFYDRREIRDLLAYLKVAANPADTVSFERVLNVPPRGIGKTTEARLYELARRLGLAPGLVVTAFPEHLATLPDAGGRRLAEFGRLLLSLAPRPELDAAPDVLERLLERVPYLQYLAEGDPVQAETRRENVAELLSAAQAFFEARLSEASAGEARLAEASGEADPEPRSGQPGSLRDFLAEVALVADIDSHRDGGELVTLMTLHNAKGLEFDTVFVTGVEEQLLPHALSLGQGGDDDGEVEEERRLFYVGLTRAANRLWVLHALNRRRFGDTLPAMPSRFLAELPVEWVEREGEELLGRNALPAAGYGGWGNWNAGGGRTALRDRQEPERSSVPWRRDLQRGPRLGAGGRDAYSQETPDADFAGEFQQDEEASALRVGLRVVHPSLGTGIVHKLEGSGEELRVIVLFDGKGARKLLARVAGLRPL
jgi:DNA helicase-2/ATP-dependent DNA helicase PcrA